MKILGGASRYLGSVIVAVLLAPVLPDVFVELFGGGEQAWVDPVLRLAALAVVLLGCVVVYWVQNRIARRRSAVVLSGIGQRDVLVLPVGFTSEYHRRGDRTGERSVSDWLVDTCRPGVVIAVVSPEVAPIATRTRAALTADGVVCEVVELPDVADPTSAVPEAERLVSGLVTSRALGGRPTYVDTTGGNVVMSLAMLRVASVLGVECTYVASRHDGKRIVPGSQVGHAFDPVALFGPTP